MLINVPHITKLANLQLKPEEIAKFEKQLSEVLEYVKKLDEVDVTDIEPTSQVTGLENVLRKDIPGQSLSQEEAIVNAKQTHNGLFKVKGIL